MYGDLPDDVDDNRSEGVLRYPVMSLPSPMIYGCVLIRRQRTVQIEILSNGGASRDNAGDTETGVRFITYGQLDALTQFK